MSGDLLRVENLRTHFHTQAGVVRAVDGVDLNIAPGRTLGVVGESGCGKSVTALSVMRLIDHPGRIEAGSKILFGERDLAELEEDELQRIRGNDISMIFQEPMTSLNPVYTVGDQIAEAVQLHQRVGAHKATERAVEMMRLVGIPSPDRRVRDYPHQMSGGMRQRVMIAMALSCNPKLLIADEPTTALDVTIQAQILELMKELRDRLGMAIMLITHDLGVVAEMADDVAVMYAGRVVERGPVEAIFNSPQHPYTEALLHSIPVLGMTQAEPLKVIRGMVPSPLNWPGGCRFATRCDYTFDRCLKGPAAAGGGCAAERLLAVRERPAQLDRARSSSVTAVTGRATEAKPLLQARGVTKHFPIRRGILQRTVGKVQAVDGVDLDVLPGETVGLVGESGCGKSTLGRALLRLVEPTAGEILFEGRDVAQMRGRELKGVRRDMQIIFQDPVGSLDPRMTVREIVSEGLAIHGLAPGRQRAAKVKEILQRVGLRPEAAGRYPHEFSGGQRQRIGIARALVLQPKFVVADEPVSALDVSIQSQVLNLLVELKREFNLTYLFVAHNLAVVGYISDRIAVMYLGKVVELAEAAELYRRPLHPYTMALLSAIPEPKPGARRQRIVLRGDVPSPINPPSGCRFRTRCPIAQQICAEVEPPLEMKPEGHVAACHFAGTPIEASA